MRRYHGSCGIDFDQTPLSLDHGPGVLDFSQAMWNQMADHIEGRFMLALSRRRTFAVTDVRNGTGHDAVKS
jgi:hypothetical protein